MAEKSPQNFANHTRLDPLFHFFVLPVFLITFIVTVVLLVQHPGWLPAWRVVVALALLLAVLKMRMYALKVQDRVIRLEERLRLAGLMPSQRAQIMLLSEDQLIGLRFAADEEVVALAGRAATEKLGRKDIKKAVKNWRGDHWRV